MVNSRMKGIRKDEQTWLDAMHPKPKTVWRVPAGSPCTSCMQTPGDSLCKSKCPYYLELLRMRDAGELKRRSK